MEKIKCKFHDPLAIFKNFFPCHSLIKFAIFLWSLDETQDFFFLQLIDKIHVFTQTNRWTLLFFPQSIKEIHNFFLKSTDKIRNFFLWLIDEICNFFPWLIDKICDFLLWLTYDMWFFSKINWWNLHFFFFPWPIDKIHGFILQVAIDEIHGFIWWANNKIFRFFYEHFHKIRHQLRKFPISFQLANWFYWNQQKKKSRNFTKSWKICMSSYLVSALLKVCSKM